ncbi:FecR family protein [Chitinophaga skermanii]|uniref:FecR family protein n=1 Tax=Chitinophaga skermanii TaxID=331697 RepID=A0A327R5T3_9BACT|nr:FecR family protein [Chitinophaga skermanii]RAJ10953.1 FecR family protein [Chitinophaga skermanii]
MPEQKPPVSILDKYLQGTCSDSERELVDAWYDQLNHASPAKQLESDATYRKVLRTKLWQEVQPFTPTLHRNTNKSKWYWAAAAAVATLVIAILGVQYNKNASYTAEISFDTIRVAPQQLQSLVLPDGSKVCMNAGTVFVYPNKFPGNQRSVEVLQGEAFFKIEKDNKRPFYVKAGDVNTEVLGTSFNLKWYQSLQCFSVSVLTGKVKVQNDQYPSEVLTAGTEAILEKGKAWNVHPIADTAVVKAWQQKELVFRQQTFEKIAATLTLQYGAKIHFQYPKVAQYRFTCKFSSKQTLQEIIGQLCLVNGNVYSKMNEKDFLIQ